MAEKSLTNKPLVEAIFELRWKHAPSTADNNIDKNYSLLVGSLYEHVKSEYPVYEPLDSVEIPDQLAAYIAQHRFRAGKGEWPLIQIGPGMVTLNETDKYTWKDFSARVSRLTETLYKIHPDPGNLNITTTLLRYIDAIEFDYEKNGIFGFLRDKMKIGIDVYPKLFENTGVPNAPAGLDLRFIFPSTKPIGMANIRFYRGRKNGQDALIWDTVVISHYSERTNKTPAEIEAWVAEAHTLTHDWFFKIIEGDLESRFQ